MQPHWSIEGVMQCCQSPEPQGWGKWALRGTLITLLTQRIALVMTPIYEGDFSKRHRETSKRAISYYHFPKNLSKRWYCRKTQRGDIFKWVWKVPPFKGVWSIEMYDSETVFFTFIRHNVMALSHSPFVLTTGLSTQAYRWLWWRSLRRRRHCQGPSN